MILAAVGAGRISVDGSYAEGEVHVACFYAQRERVAADIVKVDVPGILVVHQSDLHCPSRLDWWLKEKKNTKVMHAV